MKSGNRAMEKVHDKENFYKIYDWAGSDRSKLPWAHDEPTLFLRDIVAQRGKPGKALDIGCGAGTDSLYLAGEGWDVTSLDFMPAALEMTCARATAAGLELTTIEADVTEWEPTDKFDLVLDHGLLHNMNPDRYPLYRERVMQSVADEGEFVILHWLKRMPDEPQSEIGPTRVSREDIQKFFAPELKERFFAVEEIGGLTKSVGASMAQGYYWFKRASSVEERGQDEVSSGVERAVRGK